MSKPIAGKRYFHALGAFMRGQCDGLRLTHAVGLAGMDAVALWARNAFVEGWMGVELRRRPAWTEKGTPK